MSKHDVFMPLMIGDFLRDTMRLDTEQQGMYLLLLIEYWSKGPLPDDPRILQKICKISGHIFSKKFPDIRAIFLEKDGALFHEGLEEVKARSLALHESKSRAGKIGNAIRWSHRDGRATGEAIAKTSPSNSHSHKDSNESLSEAGINTEQPSDAPAPGEGEAVVEHGGLDEQWAAAQSEAAARQASWELALDASARLNVLFEIVIHHDTTRQWLGRGLSVEQLVSAGRIARQRKPTGTIPTKYLETIIEGEFLTPAETRHANRRQPAARPEHLSPAEIVLAACRAEQQAETGIFDGECQTIQ